MADSWKEEHDHLYLPRPETTPDGLPLGRRATVCVGGCMDGEVVYAGIGTRFFRKVNPNYEEGPQVESYTLVKGPMADVFVLEAV